MRIEIELDKSIEGNASRYFEKAKSAERKLRGVENAMAQFAVQSKKFRRSAAEKPLKKRKREWFEQFHWFYSSDGFLVLGGKNARSNEIVVKRHLDKGDMYLHADVEGASSCVVKANGKQISESTLNEAAQFAAVFSKAWNSGIAAVDAYAVTKEQVSKTAPSGETLSTGAFMIYGKRKWFRKIKLEFALGVEKMPSGYKVISAPRTAIKKHAAYSVTLVPGNQGKSRVARQFLSMLKKKFSHVWLSEADVVSMLPGNSAIN